MQISRWGNSLAIRLPASVVDVLELEEGDRVEVEAVTARTFHLQRADAADQAAIARLRSYRGLLPADFRFDRLEANGRHSGE